MEKKLSVNWVVSVKFAAFLITVANVTGVFVGIDVSSVAQQQLPLTSKQSSALEEAKRLTEQVVQLYQEGKYNVAIPLAKQSLAIRERILVKEHPDIAESLNNLAALYYAQGEYQQAEPLFQRSLAMLEKVLGKEHPLVATSINNLALFYKKQWKYQQAELLHLRALAIREKVLGKEHPDVVESLKDLANLYQEQGKYQQAEPLFQRSLAIREKVLGKEHPDVAQSLNNLANLYQEQGKYQQAERLYQRSLAIKEKVLGKEHPDVAQSLNNLAGLYDAEGKYQQAESLYQRSLIILEKALGKEHPNVAYSLNNLAVLYIKQGKYQQAELLLLRALAIREKVLGKEPSIFATSLNNLGGLYQKQGNYQQAELLYQRSLVILEKVLGKEHPNVAALLNNLGRIYQEHGKYQQAEQLLLRSLIIREKVLGKEHPDVANSLNNLAILYQEQGKYQQAEPLYQRSLAIRVKVLGKEHPDVANNLNNLATFYQEQGKYQQAEQLHLHSLLIVEKLLGKEHPDVANSLNNLAILYLAKGDINLASKILHRGLAIEEKNLQLIDVVGSEQRKQDYLETVRGTTNAIVSLVFKEGRNSPTVANLAFRTILRRKGRVLDAVADSVQILRGQLERKPETKKIFDDWLSIQQQLSAQVFQAVGKQTPEQYKAKIEQLETERQALEAAISKESAEFRQERQLVEIKTIQTKIPKNGALVEIVQYHPFDAKATKESEKWGKPRYAAVVLRSQGEPKWVDLGEVTIINESVRNLQAGLRKPQFLQPAQQAARKLDEQLMKPIRPLLGNTRHILLSPDGQLTLLPFEALVNEQGEYLIQRYAFSYLTTGRDLLRFELPVVSHSSPVVLADIDYGQAQTVKAIANPTTHNSQNLRSADLANFMFYPLSKTKDEAVAIRSFLPNVKELLGKNAKETAVKQLQAPSILHLATHGFFLSDQEINLSPLLGDSIGQPNPKVWQLENPLLRSGLALANINNRNKLPTGSDDGVLTALEVAGLNLRGTQLVVMSACDTGKGDIKVGEGVYGLRRALVIAGSQSQVLSLWKVSDEATKELMVKYYSKLKADKGRHEALREAQLEMLNSQDYKHPFFWAAFVPSGDWSALNNK